MPLDELLLPDISYPEPVVKKPNPMYYGIVSSLYAGEISELTSAMQYFYHSVILSESHPEVSAALMAMSDAEKKHLHLLANIIRQLGGDPKLRAVEDNEIIFWNAAMVDYSKTIGKIMVENIYLEKKTIQNYKIAMECIDDDGINAVFERIMLDEKLHAAVFEKIINEYK